MSQIFIEFFFVTSSNTMVTPFICGFQFRAKPWKALASNHQNYTICKHAPVIKCNKVRNCNVCPLLLRTSLYVRPCKVCIITEFVNCSHPIFCPLRLDFEFVIIYIMCRSSRESRATFCFVRPWSLTPLSSPEQSTRRQRQREFLSN